MSEFNGLGGATTGGHLAAKEPGGLSRESMEAKLEHDYSHSNNFSVILARLSSAVPPNKLAVVKTVELTLIY